MALFSHLASTFCRFLHIREKRWSLTVLPYWFVFLGTQKLIQGCSGLHEGCQFWVIGCRSMTMGVPSKKCIWKNSKLMCLRLSQFNVNSIRTLIKCYSQQAILSSEFERNLPWWDADLKSIAGTTKTPLLTLNRCYPELHTYVKCVKCEIDNWIMSGISRIYKYSGIPPRYTFMIQRNIQYHKFLIFKATCLFDSFTELEHGHN